MVELKALEEGLKPCRSLGLSKVYIEGDSQIVLNAIRNRVTPNCVLNSKLEEVLNLLDKFEDNRICHIFQEGNQIVDSLANRGEDGENLLVFRN